MARAQIRKLPDLTHERLLDRIAEAMRAGIEPETMRRYPLWTRKVMNILKEQFVPREFGSILSADGSILTEGIMVAWAAKARDFVPKVATGGSKGFARKLAERLSVDAKTAEVAQQVESGTLALSDDFQKLVMSRLFSSEFSERRAFAEGLAIGNRLPELLDRQARKNTDATGIYLLLWFYWPEISELKSIAQVARALEPFFADNKNLAGTHWDERIRKLSNRIGLSFRASQKRPRPEVD